MPTIQITAKYVNQPKEGQRSGSVKTPDGTLYWVEPSMLPSFQQNGVYEIEYTERESNGRVYKNVTKVDGRGMAARPAYNGARNSYRETSAADAERMFVCSLVNAAIQAGKVEFSEAEIAAAVRAARKAWGATFGAGEKKVAETAKDPAVSRAAAERSIRAIRMMDKTKDLDALARDVDFVGAIRQMNDADAETVRSEYAGRLKALKQAENLAA